LKGLLKRQVSELSLLSFLSVWVLFAEDMEANLEELAFIKWPLFQSVANIEF